MAASKPTLLLPLASVYLYKESSMGRGFAALVFIVSACSHQGSTSGDDVGTSPDATPADPDSLHPGVDAAPDATVDTFACQTTGNGADYSQCCLWDGAACPNNGDVCSYSWNIGRTTSNDGTCFPPMTRAAVGQTCEIGTSTCVEGAWCAWADVNQTSGTCRLLCDPGNSGAHGCAVGTCHVPPKNDSLSRIGYCE